MYDERHDEWRRRYGYKRANDEEEQIIIEYKEGDGKKKKEVPQHSHMDFM